MERGEGEGERRREGGWREERGRGEGERRREGAMYDIVSSQYSPEHVPHVHEHMPKHLTTQTGLTRSPNSFMATVNPTFLALWSSTNFVLDLQMALR